MSGRVLLLALLPALAGCPRRAAGPEPVRVFVSPDLPAAVLSEAAARFRVARVVPVESAGSAEVAWLSDPTEALALGERLAPGGAPDAAGVDARFRDPLGRFAPLGARARVLLVAPNARLPAAPSRLRDLLDPRLAGRQAVVPLGRGAGPVTVAAISLAHGESGAARFVDLLARSRPRLAATDDEVRALVAAGRADLGLAGSTEGAAGAASASALSVVYPDQAGQGAVVLPTAVVLLAGSGAAAGRLAAWLVGPEFERVAVARLPGLLPLREGVPVPVGVEPARDLRILPLDWDRLAEAERRLEAALKDWPAGFEKSQ
jgi:iron(III) transport system substrate-binding protein